MRALALSMLVCSAASAQPIATDSTTSRSPRTAVTRSLLVPGLGQLYNGEPVKAPIAAALVVGALVYAVDRQTEYVRFRRATLFAGCEQDPDSTPDRVEICLDAPDYRDEWEALGSPLFTSLRPVRDRARGQRDVSYLLVGVAYALQALDAYVAAELSDFDVSEDLTVVLEVAPRRAGLSLRVGL
ncbi:DUF5683 domain-containing protein [Rubrivirga sp.]|uniref:DUF5683 domain-containing protein n=1 Tax=Rubrivirga sp. TaxID=1885344 RepID=UPI003C738DF6